MIQHLVAWMDDHFGHNLTNIVVNATVINRGVDAVFSAPEFRRVAHLKDAVKLLLQTGFAHEYRHASWSHIIRMQGYGHVVGKFSGSSLDHLPEVRAGIVAAIDRIEQLRSG